MSVLDQVRRLLVVRLDNLGDVVLLTPALRALRAALPSAHLSLLASPAGAQLAPLLPWVDEVRAVRALWQDASGALPFDPAREQALVADLAAGGYDAAVVSTSFSQSAHPAGYACYLAGIGVRAGFAPDFAGGVLSHPVPPPPAGGHQADRSLELVAALGVPAAGRHLELTVPPAAADRARALLRSAGLRRRYAVAAPGASCPSRRYDPDRFAAVVAGLAAAGLQVAVIGSQRERALAERVAGGEGVSLAGRTTVPELAAVVAGAAVVVTNNSGPLHLADAFNRPTVALFAGTERESEYAPRRAPLRLLRVPTTCSPCRALDCPYQMECLDLAPARIVAAALDLMPSRCAA
jgi:ADP-heptose:LPS heptosyltransferase